jgi:hypothetical protein
MKSNIFREATPCTLLEVYRRFGETYCLHLQVRRVGCLARFSTMRIETIHSSETLLNFYQTTRRHIPNEGTVHSEYREIS